MDGTPGTEKVASALNNRVAAWLKWKCSTWDTRCGDRAVRGTLATGFGLTLKRCPRKPSLKLVAVVSMLEFEWSGCVLTDLRRGRPHHLCRAGCL